MALAIEKPTLFLERLSKLWLISLVGIHGYGYCQLDDTLLNSNNASLSSRWLQGIASAWTTHST